MKARIALYIVVALLIVLFFKRDREPPRPHWSGRHAPRKKVDRWLASRRDSSRLLRLNLGLPSDLTMDGWRAIGSIETMRWFRVAPIAVDTYSAIPHAEGLRELARLPKLGKVDLRFVILGDAEMDAISSLTELHWLCIQYPSGITPKGVAGIGRMSGLRSLTLIGVLLDPVGLDGLAELPRCHAIRLEECRLADEHLPLLGKLRAVRSLELRRNRIRGSGLRHLSSLRSLEHLDLTSNPLGDAGLSSLADLPELTSLNLAGTRVTDVGVASLARCRKLDTLVLPVGVGGSGLKHLATLRRLTRLELAGAVDPDAVDELRVALPKLRIEIRD